MKTKPKETKTVKTAKVPTTKTEQPESKTQQIIMMLSKPEGASIDDIQKATRWQRHSVHGFISGTLKKKMNLTIDSLKSGQERRYLIRK